MLIVNAKPATNRSSPTLDVFLILKALAICAALINARAVMPIRTENSLRKNIPSARRAITATVLSLPSLVPRSTSKPILYKERIRPSPATNATRLIRRQRYVNLPILLQPAKPVMPIRTVCSFLNSCAMVTAPPVMSTIQVRSGFAHTSIRMPQRFSSENDTGRRNAGNAMSR